MSTEMKSHGDSELVPTSWGKNDDININQQNFRIDTIKVYYTEWCQNCSLVHTCRAPRRVKQPFLLIIL